MAMGIESAIVRVDGDDHGSGFVVGDRHVVTCAHLVTPGLQATVTLPDRGWSSAAKVEDGNCWPNC